MEERLKVLKVMSEVTGRLDLNDFARKANLPPEQVLQKITELAKTDLVKKVGNGYGITEKGRNALKAYVTVPENMEFHFYTGIAQPTTLSAKTLKEFCEQLKQIDIASIEFHLYREDFENWIRNATADKPYAEELSKIRNEKLHGEKLREKLVRTTEARYSLENDQ
jgi:predicted transcriptional regulator